MTTHSTTHAPALDPAHRQLLEHGSAISADVIAERGYFTATAKNEVAILGFGPAQQRIPALVLPIYDVFGNTPPAQRMQAQIRPDNPRTQRKTGKPAKYETPQGRGMVIDVHPRMSRYMTDITRPLFITEGIRKGDALTSQDLCTLALMGVWNWKGTNDDGGKAILADLHAVAMNNGRQVILVFDSDWVDKVLVYHALANLSRVCQNRGADVRYVCLPYGPHGEKWGADDYLAAGHTVQELLALARQEIPEHPEQNEDTKTPIASEMVELLLPDYTDTWACSRYTQQWHRYAEQAPGLWTKHDDDSALRVAMAHSFTTHAPQGYTGRYLSDVLSLLKPQLVKDMAQTSGIPFQDGVLDTASLTLKSHTPQTCLTWQIPHKWETTESANPIERFLLEAMDQDASMVMVLKAFARATLLGRSDLQKFLECIGPGGSGKGTYIRLLRAMVGTQNVYPVTMHRLNRGQFEGANIYGKRLVVIADAERYSEEQSMFFNLTGGDMLPYERKYMSARDTGFTPRACTIVASNDPVSGPNAGSALERRRVTVYFNHAVPEHCVRPLVEFTEEGVLYGELAPHIAPFIRHLLHDITDTEMREWLQPRAHDPNGSLGQARLKRLVLSNPLGAWVDACVKPAKGEFVQIGTLDPEALRKGLYPKAEMHLYPSYCQFLASNGAAHPLSCTAFVPRLLDMLEGQVGWTSLQRKRRGSDGQRGIEGITLLTEPTGASLAPSLAPEVTRQ